MQKSFKIVGHWKLLFNVITNNECYLIKQQIINFVQISSSVVLGLYNFSKMVLHVTFIFLFQN